jgi:hypothetical protein
MGDQAYTHGNKILKSKKNNSKKKKKTKKT